MDAAAEIGRNPASKHHRFSLMSVENEQADAGRDGRTRLERSNSQARTATTTGEYSFCPVQLRTSRIGNLTRLIYTHYYYN